MGPAGGGGVGGGVGGRWGGRGCVCVGVGWAAGWGGGGGGGGALGQVSYTGVQLRGPNPYPILGNQPIARSPHLAAVTRNYKKPCYFTIWWRLMGAYVTDRLFVVV